MKIGIFLGYGPQVRLGKEGLGRYLGGLMKGFQAQDQEVVIACPVWLMETVSDLMEAFSIDKDRVEFINNRRDPPMWKAYQLSLSRKKRGTFMQELKSLIRDGIMRVGELLADTESVLKFVLLLAVSLLTMIILLIPALLVLVLRRLVGLLSGLVVRAYVKVQGLTEDLGIDDWQLALFTRMNDAVNENLVGLVNERADVDTWFVPSIFWQQVLDIQGTVVINAPDLVTQEFPTRFTEAVNAENAIKRCREVLLKGRYFITYCEYVKEELLLKQYGKPDGLVRAIPHVDNSMLPYIQIDPSAQKTMGTARDLTKAYARSLLARQKPIAASDVYSRMVRWDQVKYIFYASQLRPSKNILGLIKAYESLLRERFIPQKLFLTCNPATMQEVSRYIRERRLQNDVVCFYNVPAQTLAALYACADLVVNPTLYEGGFPFTFGEGMSVGTPSLMSRIPQTQDVLEPAGLEEIMFDAHDWRDMADKMAYWLPRLDELYEKELPLYRELAKRTPDVVAADYLRAFEDFMRLDGKLPEKSA